MTDEIKREVDDMKDLAHQAKLEAGIKVRDGKMYAKLGALPGHELTATEKAQTIASTKLANTLDRGEQVGLEVGKHARGAKVDLGQSSAGQAVVGAADVTAQAGSSALDGLKDAVLPATKTVQATSSRGVDITHVENYKNERLESGRREELQREAAVQEAAQEEKRKQMLASAKSKAATVRAGAAKVVDVAAVALGKVVVAATQKIDEMVDDEPATKSTAKTSSTTGIDISSVENSRNEKLRAQDQRASEARAKVEEAEKPHKSIGQKVSDLASHLKQSYIHATSDIPPAAPATTFDNKRSETGVDISSGHNPANTTLAKEDHERAKQQHRVDLKAEKAVLASKLSSGDDDDATKKKKKKDGEDADADKVTLGSSLAALGSSLSRAAAKVGSKVHEATHPLPLDVHEKVSENGVDTTSIQNANNNAIGDKIKQQNKIMKGKPELVDQNRSSELSAAALAPSAASSSSSSTSSTAAASTATRSDLPPEDKETTVIKAALDGGVAIQEAAHSLVEGVKHLGDQAATKIATTTAAPTAI